MNDQTRVFYGSYDPEEAQEEQQYLQDEYGQDEEAYPAETGMNDAYPDYDVLDEGLEERHGFRRFRVAMNVFDTAGILAGVVVILALTALIVSMVSWLRTDILHSFVILQSSIQ